MKSALFYLVLALITLRVLSWDDFKILAGLESDPRMNRLDVLAGVFINTVEGLHLASKPHLPLRHTSPTELDAFLQEKRKELPLILDVWARAGSAVGLFSEPVRACVLQETCSSSNVTIVSKTDEKSIHTMQITPPKKATRLVLFFHGGGTVYGTAFASPIAFMLAATLDAKVVSVDYSKAPERAYPHGVNDGYDVIAWGFENSKQLGVDELFVAGESGGCLIGRIHSCNLPTFACNPGKVSHR
jgi:hypothetical protein